jgi:hypothetical protein
MMFAIADFLYEGAAHIGEQDAKVGVETRCCCAINDAMIL